MSQEQPYSVKRGLQGCLVSWVCLLVCLILPISLVLNHWLGLISNETERLLALFMWLFAIGLGGYAAARLGKTTGWTNSLVVGLLAELFVLFGNLGKVGPNQGSVDLLLEMMNNLGTHWRHLVQLGLTIPVAILGGVIWQKTGGIQSPAKGKSEVVNKAERTEE